MRREWGFVRARTGTMSVVVAGYDMQLGRYVIKATLPVASTSGADEVRYPSTLRSCSFPSRVSGERLLSLSLSLPPSLSFPPSADSLSCARLSQYAVFTTTREWRCVRKLGARLTAMLPKSQALLPKLPKPRLYRTALASFSCRFFFILPRRVLF